MATWQLVEHASLTLKRLLQQHITRTLPTANIAVELATTQGFQDLKTPSRPTITLFLYRCIENPELRNSIQRRLPDGRISRPALALELCYLVTPWGARGGTTNANDAAATQEEHRLLGLILQCFYDHAEVGRAEMFEDAARPVWSPTDTMQVVMESLPVEDQYRIWDAGELPYRLSVTYRARVLGLDPSIVASTVPVVDASFVVEKT
ncbi:MAG: DUF4255 domain-containing protein [Deltaproteobacteria bacterium]|nr:DUF4255 domain-containing protein [Deltaproteobacteria bacterium]MCW5801149.1 DUF4255 domain-containing protein [Deltaproteobacteria bacterium]